MQLAREDGVDVLTQLPQSQQGGDVDAAAAAGSPQHQLPPTRQCSQQELSQQRGMQQSTQQSTQPLPLTQPAGGQQGFGELSQEEPHLTLPDADSPAGGVHSFARLLPSSEYDATLPGVRQVASMAR